MQYHTTQKQPDLLAFCQHQLSQTARSGTRFPACHAGGRGFESRRSRKGKYLVIAWFLRATAQFGGQTASTSSSTVRGVVGSVLLLMLIVPVILPAAISAYSVVGERDQGTLEPLLTTPVRRG